MSAPVTLSPSLLDSSNATKQSLNGSGNGKKTFVGGVSMNKDDSFTSSSEGTRYSNISSTSAGYRSRLRILIVRHGETDHNVQGIIQGQLDTDLNAIGRKQAHFVAQSLANEYIDEVYSSPLKRASDTAKAIVEQNPNRKYDRMQFWYDKRLKERGFGSLEGRKYDRSKPKRDSIDGIEQTNVFCDRLASFLSDAVVRSAPFEQQTKTNSEWVDEPDSNATTYPAEDSARMQTSGPPPHLNRAGCSRTIVLVAHGAAISAMVGNVLLDTGIAAMSAGVQRTRIWNCSVTEVIVNDVNGLPLLSNGKLDMKALANREGKKAFVVERWADVRHIPADLEEAAATGAANGSADEMIGRSTN